MREPARLVEDLLLMLGEGKVHQSSIRQLSGTAQPMQACAIVLHISASDHPTSSYLTATWRIPPVLA